MSKKHFVWWWLRDFDQLPDSPEQLIEHAKILNGQARTLVVDLMTWGAITGLFGGLLILAAYELVIRKIFVDPGGTPLASITILHFILVMIASPILGAGAGMHLAQGRAFRLRAVASIALSLARIETQLSKFSEKQM